MFQITPILHDFKRAPKTVPWIGSYRRKKTLHKGRQRHKYIAVKQFIRRRRWRKRWAKRRLNWWRYLLPESMQPEHKRVFSKGIATGYDKFYYEFTKRAFSGIGGIGEVERDDWWMASGRALGYDRALASYIYRKRPADFEGFAKYFLTRITRVKCLEDAMEINDLYEFIEEKFPNEMKTEARAVQVHVAWMQIMSRFAEQNHIDLFTGRAQQLSEEITEKLISIGLTGDRKLVVGSQEPVIEGDRRDVVEGDSYYNTSANSRERQTRLSKLKKNVRNPNKQVPSSKIKTDEDSTLDKELNDFLKVARFVHDFESRLNNHDNDDARMRHPNLARYLIVKNFYEQTRHKFQWHPLCAGRTVDFVREKLKDGAFVHQRFFKYFTTPNSLLQRDFRAPLKPNSYAYEALLRSLLAARRFNKFVEYSRFFNSEELHNKAMAEIFKTNDYVLLERFFLRTFHCSIDDLTKRQNILRPSPDTLAMAITSFTRNRKWRAVETLIPDLKKQIANKPEALTNMKMSFKDLKDFTKLRHVKLYGQLSELGKWVSARKKALGVDAKGTTLPVANVDPLVVSSLRETPPGVSASRFLRSESDHLQLKPRKKPLNRPRPKGPVDRPYGPFQPGVFTRAPKIEKVTFSGMSKEKKRRMWSQRIVYQETFHTKSKQKNVSRSITKVPSKSLKQQV